MRGAGVVAHVSDVIEPLIADFGEQADLAGGAEQVGVVDPGQILVGPQVPAQVAGSGGDVVEVGKVETAHPAAKLADQLVPQVVQRRVEQSTAAAAIILLM